LEKHAQEEVSLKEQQDQEVQNVGNDGFPCMDIYLTS